MAKTKEKKQAEVKSLSEKLGKMKITVLTNFTGLKVKELNELRTLLRKEKIDYQAAKKTLLQRALKESNLPEDELAKLSGSLALAFGYEDEVLPPKLLEKFKKDHGALQIIGGFYENRFIFADQVSTLASIPSKGELLGKLAWSLQSPISGFNWVIKGNLQKLMNVLNQIKAKATN